MPRGLHDLNSMHDQGFNLGHGSGECTVLTIVLPRIPSFHLFSFLSIPQTFIKRLHGI